MAPLYRHDAIVDGAGLIVLSGWHASLCFSSPSSLNRESDGKMLYSGYKKTTTRFMATIKFEREK